MRDDTFNDLFKLIDTLDTIDDLNIVKDMLGVRNSDLAKETKSGLIVGEEVTISGSNRIDSGKIVKINRTRAVVDCYDKNRDSMIHYTVPFSMIRKVVQQDG